MIDISIAALASILPEGELLAVMDEFLAVIDESGLFV